MYCKEVCSLHVNYITYNFELTVHIGASKPRFMQIFQYAY